MTETEPPPAADAGPCACNPAYHRVGDTRKNATADTTRRRYRCLFCLRRWTMYECTAAEMERMRQIESGVIGLLKAIGKA